MDKTEPRRRLHPNLTIALVALAVALVPAAAALGLTAGAQASLGDGQASSMAAEPEVVEEVPRCDGPEPSICGGCDLDPILCAPECADPMEPACQPGCDADPEAPGCEACPAITLTLAELDGSILVTVDAHGDFTLLRSEGGDWPTLVGNFTGATSHVDANVSLELFYAYAVVVDGVVCVTDVVGIPTCEEVLGIPDCEAECGPTECLPPCMDEADPMCTECPATAVTVTANGDGSVLVHVMAEGEFELWRAAEGQETPEMLGTFTGETTYVDTNTTVGVAYSYAAFVDGVPCDFAEVVSVPDIPLGLGAIGAAGLGAVGYAFMRRRA